jgi:NADH dehydrogenase
MAFVLRTFNAIEGEVGLKVAIIGGGIAGAEILRNALPGPFEITLIEPKQQIECQALYPEYLAGMVRVEDLTAPLKPFCERVGAEFVNEHAIRLEKNLVICNKSQVEYDLAVIATGAIQNYFDILGADRTFSANSLEGIMKARDFLERRKPDKIAIIGAGLTGIEIACNLMESTEANIYLVETKTRMLPQFSENISRMIEKTLSEKGVKTLVSTKVLEIKEDRIELCGGKSMECDMAIWTAGIKPCDLVQSLPFAKWRNEWILADPYLRASENIFALGDNAWIEIDGKVASKTAVEAERQARHMARNLAHLAEGKSLKRYSILASTDSQVALISIGRECAVGVYGDVCVTMPTKIIHALKYWIDKSFIQRFK